jgi:hypothetical protein
MKKNFMVILYLGHGKVFFFYVGNRTLGTYLVMVKSFGEIMVPILSTVFSETINSYL